jgi:enoyl-CoA hydratase
MDRPSVRNAQSARLLDELDDAFAEAIHNRDVQVIILSGIGDAFSSGHDLGTAEHLTELEERRQFGNSEIEGTFDYSYSYFLDMSLRWRELPKPTIAQVHGWCLFGGWLIASAMDLITASTDAKFGTSFLQYFPLAYEMSPREAKRLVFDPHIMSAAEAHDYRFVTLVAEPAELEKETEALAERIAKRQTFWLRMAKSAINQAQDSAGFRSSMISAHAHHQLYIAHERETDRRSAGLDPTPPLPIARRRPIMDQLLEDTRKGRIP